MDFTRIHNSTIRIDTYLYSENDCHDINDNVFFLSNASDLPFITGDQPVINLTYNGDVVNDLYFPISPKYAIIKCDAPINKYIRNCEMVTESEVMALNDKIAEWRLSQLFSSNEISLQKYIIYGSIINVGV